MKTLVFLATFLISVVSFDDLREKTCRTSKVALKNIATDQVEWYGEISLGLVCDEGYDYPLNFNPETSTNTITCKSNNLWLPDFLPDCNRKIVISYENSTGIQQCPEGSLQVKTTEDLRCRGCPIGQFLSGEKCTPCSKGYYQDTPMQNVCKKCPFLEHETDEEIMSEVRRVSRDRQYHLLGCPVLHRLENGTVRVMTSPEDFRDEMRNTIGKRDEALKNISHVKAISGMARIKSKPYVSVTAVIAAMRFVRIACGILEM